MIVPLNDVSAGVVGQNRIPTKITYKNTIQDTIKEKIDMSGNDNYFCIMCKCQNALGFFYSR